MLVENLYDFVNCEILLSRTPELALEEPFSQELRQMLSVSEFQLKFLAEAPHGPPAYVQKHKLFCSQPVIQIHLDQYGTLEAVEDYLLNRFSTSYRTEIDNHWGESSEENVGLQIEPTEAQSALEILFYSKGKPVPKDRSMFELSALEQGYFTLDFKLRLREDAPIDDFARNVTILHSQKDVHLIILGLRLHSRPAAAAPLRLPQLEHSDRLFQAADNLRQRPAKPVLHGAAHQSGGPEALPADNPADSEAHLPPEPPQIALLQKTLRTGALHPRLRLKTDLLQSEPVPHPPVLFTIQLYFAGTSPWWSRGRRPSRTSTTCASDG